MMLRLPSRSELTAAALALAVTAMFIGISGHLLLLTSEFQQYPDFAMNIGYARPPFLLILTLFATYRSLRWPRLLLLVVTLIQIPYMGDRSGGGISEKSELIKIRFAELIYASKNLFDVSASLFIIGAVLLLFTTKRSKKPATDEAGIS